MAIRIGCSDVVNGLNMNKNNSTNGKSATSNRLLSGSSSGSSSEAETTLASNRAAYQAASPAMEAVDSEAVSSTISSDTEDDINSPESPEEAKSAIRKGVNLNQRGSSSYHNLPIRVSIFYKPKVQHQSNI